MLLMALPKQYIRDEDAAHWTPKRKKLLAWFETSAPTFKDGYIAAVELLHCDNFPARTHLICHTIRDIYNFLPQKLGIDQPAQQHQTLSDFAKQLGKVCEQSGFLLIKKEENKMYKIHPKIYRHIKKIINKIDEMPDTKHNKGAAFAEALRKGTSNNPSNFARFNLGTIIRIYKHEPIF